MIKIITIIGARPQFIKAAAISRAIQTKFSHQINEVIVHTGQHYDPNLSQVFFEELNIPKEKYNLNIGSGSHAEQTASMLVSIEKVIIDEQPDLILLYGDTNSTLSACLAAIKLHLPIIHIEAGVRSYNKTFPEEVNRLVCDHFSSALFVPSDAGMDGLKKEGFDVTATPKKPTPDSPAVFRCGDIMYDNTLYFLEHSKQKLNTLQDKFDLPKDNFILATMHRPSNVDQEDTLESIFKAFRAIADQHGKTIILPLHPRTKHKLEQFPEIKALSNHEKIRIIPPVSFLEIIGLEKNSDLVITDSGGVQKEAFFVKKPCLIMLEETPWTELIESGNALLVGSNFDKITEGADRFFNNDQTLVFDELYGDGKASEFICERIVELFENN